MDRFHVVPHVAFGDGPLAVPAQDLLAFDDFLALAVVVDWHPPVTSLAVLLVLAPFHMAGITPFATMGTLHALGTVGLHQLPGPKRLSTVFARVL